MHTLWQDIRFGLRMLRRSPGFTLIATVSLALGIGANSAIFQLLDAVRLRNLPVKDPQELVEVTVDTKTGRWGQFTSRYPKITNPLWEQIRAHQRVFSQVFAWGNTTFDLSTGGEAHDAEGLWVSGDFFRTLGVAPVAGRVFTTEDDQRGCGSPGAVISYGFWQRQFGGNPAAVGSKLTLYGHPFDIIGVTPQQFFGMDVGHSFEVALPICAEPLVAGEHSALDSRWTWFLSVIGRLKPGVTMQQATAQLRAVAPGIFEATVPPELPASMAKDYQNFQLKVEAASTGLSDLRKTYETPLWLLIGIAGVVLLIACANLANLLLARATTRKREMAVRLAIGASRRRLARQLLVESLLLAVLGSAFGILLAVNLSRALISFLTTTQDTVFLDLQLDWRLLAFTSSLAVLTSVLFGLTPALRGTRFAPSAAMKAGGRGATGQREGFRLQRVLVSTQVALSLVLLFAALLFVRTFRNLTDQNPGFRDAGVVEVDLDLRRAGFPDARFASLRRELLDRLSSTPGVESAAEAEEYPMSGSWSNDNVRTDADGKNEKGWKLSNICQISPGYFRTLGTPLLAGRDFNSSDIAGAPRVAIVTEAFVRQFFPGANPIGRTFRTQEEPNKPEPVYEIIGVAANSRHRSMREDFKPLAYLAAWQVPRPTDSLTFVVLSRLPAADVTAGLRRAIAETSPAISIRFSIFKTKVEESLLKERLMATLSGFFGALATLLAIIGLYGVISYTTARRKNEIGIRMALGAAQADVVGMILRQTGILMIIGLAAGAVLAVIASRAAKALLYGLEPGDPATLLVSLGLLAAVGLLAGYIPAHRASGVDPMLALRDE
jgi:predicted permease